MAKKAAIALDTQAPPAPKLDAKKIYDEALVVEEELKEIKDLRVFLESEEERLKPYKDRLKKLVASVISKLDSKSPIVGALLATIAEKSGKRSPKWEQEFFGHYTAEHGYTKEQIEALKEQILSKYQPGVTRELVIQPRPQVV